MQGALQTAHGRGMKANVIRFSAPMGKEYRSKLIDDMAMWGFRPHNLEEEDLFRAACILFDGLLSSEGLAELQIDRGGFIDFTLRVTLLRRAHRSTIPPVVRDKSHLPCP